MNKGQKPWDINAIQFPRLLAEIRAAGLSKQQYHDLYLSAGLSKDEVDELLERAEDDWQVIALTWK